MSKFTNPTTGVTVEQENRSVEDLANQGFYPDNKISDSAILDPTRGAINAGSATMPEISLDSLKSTEPVNLPDATTPQDEPDETVASAGQTVKNVDDYIKELTPTTTKTQEKETGFLEDIANLTGQLGQQPGDQLAKEEELGIPKLREDFANINSQILTKSAEYDALRNQLEDKPITMGSIMGQQARVKREKASEIGILQAMALGLQGQISTAQATADRAIDLKYSVIENNLAIYEAQLRAIQPQLNREQQVLAQAQQQMLYDERARVEEEKAEAKSVQSVALIAQQNGADGALLDQISKATTQLEAQQIAGELGMSGGWQYVGTYEERDRLVNEEGYEMTQSGGRTYVRKPNPAVASYASQIRSGAIKLANVPAEYRNAVSVAVGAYTPPASGGGGKVIKPTTFKFSSDDMGRLLAANFTNAEANQIQADINEYGIEQTVAGMSEAQANVVRNIAKGITPTQEASGVEFLTESYIRNEFEAGLLEDHPLSEYDTWGWQSKATKEKRQKEAIDKEIKSIIDQINELRESGLSDKEINKLI